MAAAIELKDLTATYREGGSSVEALRGISLRVEEGEVFGFIGPNGSGKTSTMHVLLGFLHPSGGEARMLGMDTRGRIARERIGYLPERAEAYPFLTGRELLAMAGRLFGMGGAALRRRIDSVAERVRISDALDRRIATYSRGMLQRAGIAQALVNDPDLLLLDEPTGGMDPIGRMEIRSLIAERRARGKTVFFSSHELSEVELACDRVAIIAGGRIAAAGAVAELVPAAGSLERYFLEVVGGAAGPGGGAP